jgi:excisionase family DNA binding protein
MSTNEKPALTIGEAGQLAGYSRERIHRAIVAGHLRFRRVSDRRMIDLQDLRQWISEGARQ